MGEPKPMNQESAYARDPRKRCAFHQDFGHSTENCIQLRRVIQRLIDDWQLNEYKSNYRGRQNNGGDNRRGDRDDRHVVHMIREPTPSVTQIRCIMYSLSIVPSEPEYIESGDVISFRQNELAHTFMARNQPIVIQVGIHRSHVKRLLIDTGVSMDVLFYWCFKEFGLSKANLTLTAITLEGFTSRSVQAERIVNLGDSWRRTSIEDWNGPVCGPRLRIPIQCNNGNSVPISFWIGALGSSPKSKVPHCSRGRVCS